MKNQARWALALALGVGLVQQAQAEEKILVQVPAILDAGAGVGDAIKRDCSLESLMGSHAFESVNKKFPGSTRVEKAEGAQGKVLKLTITSVIGAGGGAWSGPKTMTVRAELLQSGKVVASTVKSRSSGGGAFGGMKGTCQIFDRVMTTLGSDVAAWLPDALKGK